MAGKTIFPSTGESWRKNPLGALYLWVLRPQIQQTMDSKYLGGGGNCAEHVQIFFSYSDVQSIYFVLGMTSNLEVI